MKKGRQNLFLRESADAGPSTSASDFSVSRSDSNAPCIHADNTLLARGHDPSGASNHPHMDVRWILFFPLSRDSFRPL